MALNFARAADGVPDIAALRASMVAARGSAPANYRDTITWKLADGTLAKEQTFKRDGNTRVVEDEDGIHSETGTFKGDNWHQNKNGLTVFDERDPLAAGRTARETAKVEAGAAGGGLLVINDVGANGLGTREYVDPQTFRSVRLERISRRGMTTTTYEDYAKFGTQSLLSHWTVTTPLGSTQYTRTERVADAATPTDVTMPGIRRLLVEFPGTAPVQIPVTVKAGRIYVRLSLNGHPYLFLLDSGAGGISVDSDVVRQLGLPLINRQINGANAGAQEEFDAIVPEIKIGPLTMRDIVVAAGKIAFEQDLGFKVVGLLGFDFFATLGVTVDYEHSRVTVAPAATYVPPAGSAVVPIDIRLGDQVPMIEVALDGVVASRFIVDTGNGTGAFSVYDYFMDRHPNIGERSGQEVRVSGVGGTITTRPIFFHSFRLGTYDFQDFGGLRMGSGSYAIPEDGTVGILFLVLFTIDFDYPHGRMYLTPTTNTKQMLHIR